MPLDSLFLNGINLDLRRKIRNSKIDKIYQPHPLDIIFYLRQNQDNFRLFLSAHPQYARIHLSTRDYENPITPPAFCMLLRKYLENSRLVDLEQPNFERVIRLYFQALYPIDGISQLVLVIEIMGKHSNIILLNRQNSIILGAVKILNQQENRFREIFPGLKYIAPPNRNKVNPLECQEEEFTERINSQLPENTLLQALLDSFVGLSPLMVKEILYRAELPHDTNSLSPQQLRDLWQIFSKIYCSSYIESSSPILFIDQGKVVNFSLGPLKQYQNLESSFFNDPSSLLDLYYGQRQIQDHLNQKKRELISLVEREIKRCSKKLSLQEQDLKKAEKAEIYKIKGELILANLYQLGKGQNTLKVKNYYHPSQEEIEIELDPKYSPTTNAQIFFKKYHKAKNSVLFLEEQITKGKEEENYLEGILFSLEAVENVKELDAIKEELQEEKYLKEKKNSKTKSKKSVPSPLKFLSSDGLEILVGRNNKENDYLTLKLANNNDFWLHVKDIPGSHVIIRTNKLKLPDKTLEEAAILAAYFSKAKNSAQIPVDYTLKKHVKKPSGAKPGMVIYQEQKTLYVTPHENIIKTLKKTKN